MLALAVLAGGMLVAAIVAANQIDDEKIRYFVIGYYVAIHHGLVRWLWKKLRVEKNVRGHAETDLDTSGNSPISPRSP
jgi:hypothetical protein